ncbi:arginase family protein [Massilia sp. MB5]|uniref:arginase family protein n=1 Tax=unclassified Massilia TaxID=2609279 RepID=UPI00067E21E3|nr:MULTISPECIES: arginase family protein [unclassified Massilia]AKU22701.1 arginase [Massilia sp. NR 4-1]UMR32491.1 arginase family protein [Massilia sp. MB5]
MRRRFLVPYLMGQRRDGLARVAQLDTVPWQVLALPGRSETKIADKGAQMASMGQVYAGLADQVCRAVQAGEQPVSISGDCISTLGMLAGLQQAGCEPRRILWLDAHGDFHTWGTTQTQYLGGMPLAMLVGRQDRRQNSRDAIEALRKAVGVRPYPEQRVLLSDARDLDPGEDVALRASDIVCCRFNEIEGHLRPEESLYVHFDTDVMDAAELAALKYHVGHGPSYAETAELFRRLARYPIAAVSVSAWHGDRDADDRTALACLELLHLLLPAS